MNIREIIFFFWAYFFQLGNVDNCAELVTDLIKFAKILEIEIKDYCFDLDDNAILSRVNDKTNDSNNIDNQASASSQLSREEYFEENQNNVKVEVKPEFDIIDLDSESEDGEILEINGGEKDCTVPKISLVPVQVSVGDVVKKKLWKNEIKFAKKIRPIIETLSWSFHVSLKVLMLVP